MNELTSPAQLPTLRIANDFELEQCASLPHTKISVDWFGEAVPVEVHFALALSEQDIFFSARVEMVPWHNDSLRTGAFTPELWKMDVAELFLCEEKSTAYQEFNLAPSGAWWSFLFSEYRKEDEQNFQELQNVRCQSELSASNWNAAIQIPREELSLAFDGSEDSRANVCFILGQPEDRRFLSWAELSPEKPDFHELTRAQRLKFR